MAQNNISQILGDLKNEEQIFLNYLRAKFPVFHNSTLFSRDFQYGLMHFMDNKGKHLTDNEASSLSKQFSDHYETKGIFIKTGEQSWKLNYPDFVTTKPGDPFSF